MPATSESQQRLMGMALAAKRGKGHFSGKVKEIADSMSEKQLHDFAATKHKGLPEKKAQIELIKWAMGNSPQLALPGGGGMVPNARPYYGPTSGPGVVNMGQAASRLGTAAKFIGGRALPAVGGIMGAMSASERARNGDNVGAWIDRVGAMGSAASMTPNPYAMGIGTAVNLGAMGLNYWRDQRKAKQMAQQQPQPGQQQPQPGQQPALTQASPLSGSAGGWEQATPQQQQPQPQPGQPQVAQQQPGQVSAIQGGVFPGQTLGNPQGVSIQPQTAQQPGQPIQPTILGNPQGVSIAKA